LALEDVAAREEADVQEDAAEQEHPEAERVEAREGDVARPDHQRDQQVHEGDAERHDDEEDHRRAVHREDGVVLVGVQERLVRRRELDAHEQRLDAPDEEEDEGRQAVHDADLLVVDGGQPAPQPLGRAGVRLAAHRKLTRHCSRHEVYSVAPAACAASPAGALSFTPFDCNHASKSCWLSTITRKRICAWPMPQNSAHWPEYSPGVSDLIHMWLM